MFVAIIMRKSNSLKAWDGSQDRVLIWFKSSAQPSFKGSGENGLE